jgi:hypothetical protein
MIPAFIYDWLLAAEHPIYPDRWEGALGLMFLVANFVIYSVATYIVMRPLAKRRTKQNRLS